MPLSLNHRKRKTFLDSLHQSQLVREFWPSILVMGVLLPSLLLLLAMALSAVTGTSIASLTRDPWAEFVDAAPEIVIAQVPVYVGFLSHLNVMIWVASAAISGAAALYVRQIQHQRKSLGFLLYFSALSLIIALDDLYMFHEHIGPMYFGVPEKVIYLTYALALFGYVVYFFQEIRQNRGVFLGVSLMFLAASVAFDILLPHASFQVLIEDAFKIFGGFWWLLYAIHSSTAVMRRSSKQHWFQRFEADVRG